MLGDCEVDPAQHLVVTEGLADVPELDRVHARASSRRRLRAISQSVKRVSGIVSSRKSSAVASRGV